MSGSDGSEGDVSTVSGSPSLSSSIATTALVTGVPIITGQPLGPDKEIFLRTAAAQSIAGVFSWAALLITCHQVSIMIFFKFVIIFIAIG